MEHDGIEWNRTQKDVTGWNRLGQVGAGWNRLEQGGSGGKRGRQKKHDSTNWLEYDSTGLNTTPQDGTECNRMGGR